MTLPDDRPLPGCLWTVTALLALLVAFGLAAGVAHCQDAPTVIARTFISEEGWDREDGWASLGAVMRDRVARGLSPDLRSAAVALSPRLHDEDCEVTTRRWRCDLDPDLHRPEGLTGTWTAMRAGGLPSRRDRLAAALDAAARLLVGDLPDDCRTAPRAWGSAADVRRRILAGERWVDSGCPGANLYGRRLVRR
jgi:hypothetical protein